MTGMENQAFPKRFYKSVTVEKTDSDDWLIALDGRPAKTPGKKLLAMPVRSLAEAVADEWEAQTEEINPFKMLLCRRRMVVIDRGEADCRKWGELILSFLRSDLLCYRAEKPEPLTVRQTTTWSEFLEWISGEFGIRLNVTTGIVSVEQPDDSQTKTKNLLRTATADELSCLAAATEITGSAVLALALWQKYQTPDEIFAASRVDETYQSEKWGIDEDAAKNEARLREDFLSVARYLDLIQER